MIEPEDALVKIRDHLLSPERERISLIWSPGRFLAAALRALDGNDRVVGAFLWKWFAGPTVRENFLMSTPAMRNVIARHWATVSSAP